MLHFIADATTYDAHYIPDNLDGVLSVYTEMKIRGDYRKGPVPVSVTYFLKFALAEKHLHFDEEDDAFDSESFVLSFSSVAEREFALKKNFDSKKS